MPSLLPMYPSNQFASIRLKIDTFSPFRDKTYSLFPTNNRLYLTLRNSSSSLVFALKSNFASAKPSMESNLPFNFCISYLLSVYCPKNEQN